MLRVIDMSFNYFDLYCVMCISSLLLEFQVFKGMESYLYLFCILQFIEVHSQLSHLLVSGEPGRCVVGGV